MSLPFWKTVSTFIVGTAVTTSIPSTGSAMRAIRLAGLRTLPRVRPMDRMTAATMTTIKPKTSKRSIVSLMVSLLLHRPVHGLHRARLSKRADAFLSKRGSRSQKPHDGFAQRR